MNLILEGPDGAGKTYLAEQLSQLLNMGVRHFNTPSEDLIGKQFDFYRDIGIDLYNTILDRSWYSDMVYGPIFRGETEIRHNLMLELERCYTDTFVIYCTGDPELMWQAALERGENYVQTFDQYKEICQRYDDIMYNMYHLIPIYVRRATWLSQPNES